ncbi:MAG: pilus assembly protein [Chloroflexi bacterium]|nr:pilus assembly protein [Chloroflexota bacterium]
MRRLGARWRDARGQALVEFTMLVPVFTLVLLGMLEFGFVFDHTLTIRYASREGARVGSALANGSASVPCASVDQYVVAAVMRVLSSPGSRVHVADVPTIRIYKALASGDQSGSLVNVWTYSPGAGPVVDGKALDYVQSSVAWSACSRINYEVSGAPPDSIGVSLTYTYRLETALGPVLRFFGGSGWSTITISDRSVMALNPTN